MSKSVTTNRSYTAGQVSYAKASTISGDGFRSYEISVPAAKQNSQLTVRGSNTAGTLTFTAHGIPDASLVSLFWSESGVRKYRRHCLVGTTAANTIPISGGSGDNLPVLNTTNIQICVEVSQDEVLIGDNVFAILVKALISGVAVGAAQFMMYDATPTEHMAVTLVGAPYIWTNDDGTTNPIATDTPTKFFLSHDGTAAATFNIDILAN